MGRSLIAVPLWIRQLGCDLQLLVIWVTVYRRRYPYQKQQTNTPEVLQTPLAYTM